MAVNARIVKSNESSRKKGLIGSVPARAPMTQHRRRQILELVKSDGAAHVNALAQKFGVSTVTIRNDLTKLAEAGELLRDRGGAISTASSRQVTHLLGLNERAILNREAKQRIGKAAAQLVAPGDTIIMDAGTTVVEMASHLAGIIPLTVVTNALNVALTMGAATEAQLIFLGGTLSREASSTVGPLAEQTLANLAVQKVFLGTQALDLKSGLTDTTLEIAQAKRAMIKAARQVFLLADSSKWDQTGFIKVAQLEEIDALISDEKLPASARTAVERLGIRLILV
jgi:DeoR/GlpR family transcriptional regulator of sugar metabolism